MQLSPNKKRAPEPFDLDKTRVVDGYVKTIRRRTYREMTDHLTKVMEWHGYRDLCEYCSHDATLEIHDIAPDDPLPSDVLRPMFSHCIGACEGYRVNVGLLLKPERHDSPYYRYLPVWTCKHFQGEAWSQEVAHALQDSVFAW